MTILTRDEFVEAIREAIVDNFGSEEAFIEAWNRNIDALEELDRQAGLSDNEVYFGA